MLIDTYRVLTGKVSKTAKQGLYKNGFFFSSGLFAGIALNDLFRLADFDVNFKKTWMAGSNNPELRETRQDEIIQYGIVAAAVIISVITGKYVNEVIPIAGGAALGIAWANRSERGGDPISILPF